MRRFQEGGNSVEYREGISNLQLEQSNYKMELAIGAAKVIGGTGAIVGLITFTAVLPNPLTIAALGVAVVGSAHS